MAFLSSLPGILLIILGFGVLIFIHELGHFIAAKWAGIRTEAFAVGMGPVAVSWRKGIGVCIGSTDRKVVAKCGKPASEMPDAELREHAIGETEYSLRYLPIGGFVKMLGQEDARPGAISNDPRSYTERPVGKRMIVVSAGVIMNVLLALVLFVWAFMVGVRFEAPVIGEVRPMSPAATAEAIDAAEFGVRAPGIHPGDEVIRINGEPARTFADIQIATAMARPGTAVSLAIRRAGIDGTLNFLVTPEPSLDTGLLSIGVGPARSARLMGTRGRDAEIVDEYLRTANVYDVGVRAGMDLVSVEDQAVGTYGEMEAIVDGSRGGSVRTRWSALDENGRRTGAEIEAELTTQPRYQQLLQLAPGGQELEYDTGLLGLCPLMVVGSVLDGSANVGRLEPGDIIIRVGDVEFPRWTQLRAEVARHAGASVEMVVLRDEKPTTVQAIVNAEGMLGIGTDRIESMPVTTAPVDTVVERAATGGEHAEIRTPTSGLSIEPGTVILAVGDERIEDWPDLRRELRAQTESALGTGRGIAVMLLVSPPEAGAEKQRIEMHLRSDDVHALHDLGWKTDLHLALFEPLYTKLSAEGNPVRAVTMGFGETHKTIVMTYLTIDRLFRGSVGVKQLRGPVGIIDLGARILPKGFMYFIFFLGMISVNLAVLNFLPLPIVDGGLFLFLIYEKIKGRPPSVQFQNAATIVGLCIIGTVFVVTFYNDIARLLS
ncbi:MAG: site-2 protease family protein [Planctomycetota bacterium]|jgi:regulator of sigma E protease